MSDQAAPLTVRVPPDAGVRRAWRLHAEAVRVLRRLEARLQQTEHEGLTMQRLRLYCLLMFARQRARRRWAAIWRGL